ncbi:MAG: ribosomal protein [Rickettsiales bacterium]|jgi:large subunit ribosomal protein L13|nr:ribosomal protein [Rickettsiales bacterium]
MTTTFVKLANIKREWFVIDAEDLVLGRLAAEVSKLLRGRHKAWFSPNLDCGDYIIITNADKIHLTGKKAQNKVYYRHTGHPGGIKETTPEKLIRGEKADRIIEKAIERMIPRSALGREQMKKLHIYSGAEHPHQAQQPKALDIGARNRKNKKKAA